MVVDISSVPHGTTFNDRTHFGIRQGGNKSTLTYRNDIGIPGYMGFIPSQSCIAPLPKGSTLRTGKVADEDSLRRSTLIANDQHTKSLYSTTHAQISPDEYKPTSMHGNTMHQQSEGGYWIEQASLPGHPKPFTAKSTYQEEVLKSPDLQEKALSKTSGITMTTHLFSSGLRRSTGEMNATGARLVRTAPPALVTQKGDTIGYKTCYQSMVLKDPLTGGSAAPGGPRVPSQPPSNRARVLPHAMSSPLQSHTTYTANHGAYGHDPMTRTATSHKDMSMTATTNDINQGTSRTTQHIPGFSGFLPCSDHNTRAVTHATGAIPRTSEKVSMLLHSLDQYSRERLPRYGGSRPQANQNIRLDQQPSLETTIGHINFQTTRRAPPGVDRSHFANSNKGTGSFFTDGGAFKSDNGKFEADRFYMSLRPLEGHPHMGYADQRTAYGGKFTS